MGRFIPKGDTDLPRGWPDLDPAELRHLWNKARASLGRNPKDAKKAFTLEVRPEEVKFLYARVQALQALVDGRLDPREIKYLYVFGSQDDLPTHQSTKKSRRATGCPWRVQ